MSVFGRAYARAYDTLYGEKDYAGECDMIEALLALNGAHSARLLDLGCGTGNHAIPLALRGHEVTGVDLSADMLARARGKAAAAGVTSKTRFHCGDIRQVCLKEKGFDAAIMMFAVLGYQQADADVRAALSTARAHLKAGAPFLFDVWYGPGVMADKPGPRERVIQKADERIVRRTDSILDEPNRLCTVKFDLEIWRDGERRNATHEEHVMRYFFADEIERFAAECAFAPVTLRNFPDWQHLVSDTSWNAVGMLRAV